jgi:hypothetical protein
VGIDKKENQFGNSFLPLMRRFDKTPQKLIKV